MISCRIWLFLAALWTVSVAEARVLNLQTEKFAPYIRGQYQQSTIAQTPYSLSSGTGNAFDKSYSTVSNYEFGFVYSIKDISLRFGFEVIYPSMLKEISGTDASGTQLFTLDSDIAGYVPKIGLDINVKQWPQSRIFLNANYGMATVTLQNSYGFTAAGQTAYPSLIDFREETKGSAALMEYSVGWEFLAFDTTTMVIDAGYRLLRLDSFSHNVPVTSFQGGVVKGDKALADDGTDRRLDLSGYFASVQFRFWVF